MSHQPEKPPYFERFAKMNLQTPLGYTLLLELQAQIDAKNITEDQARVILQAFNESFYQQMQLLSQQKSTIEGHLEANMDLFRFFDDQADLELGDVEISYKKPEHGRKRFVDKVFIQALDVDRIPKKPIFHIHEEENE